MSLIAGISAIGYLSCLLVTFLGYRNKRKFSRPIDLILLALTIAFSVLLVKEYLNYYLIKEGSSLIIMLCVFALMQIYSILKSTSNIS
jgi:hypothetical protein